MSKVEITLDMTDDAEVFDITEDFTLGEDLDLIVTELRIDNGEDYVFPEVDDDSIYDTEFDIDGEELSIRVGGKLIVDITDEQIENIRDNGIGFVIKHIDEDGDPVSLDEELGLEPDTFICTFDISIKKL